LRVGRVDQAVARRPAGLRELPDAWVRTFVVYQQRRPGMRRPIAAYCVRFR
jgi:hypothetical protein